jgi:hypothetical protein
VRALAVALVLAFATTAHAQAPAEAPPAEPADPEVAAIRAAFDANQFGEMHTLATALVAKRPDDAEVRYLAAVSAQRTMRYDEARAHCESGLASHPAGGALIQASRPIPTTSISSACARRCCSWWATNAEPSATLAARSS